MGRWFRFFIGTPQRFLATGSVVALVTVVANPGLLRMAIDRLLAEISPLFGPIIQLAVVIFAFKVIFQGVLGGGRRGRRD